ncbi:Kelch-type beta propeller [Arabidopsis thaliana x Arabidopsis arenosa]|uniref:Kelch-type beta propeller n=1 Tax=Arabidopsis thaliana x Arabidopsis arenosa TaxID=1240361 RepID=A0A8T1YD01_9BRAS|nr:Kelch-type beta propeller [Arabidopsis thaliana x Arabidopsis arenosa]
MSSPEKLSPAPESNSNPSLPDALLISCIARISRLYYPTLSLVSKSFRSLLASPELYKARLLLDRTESCLYVCLKLSPSENPSWFTLCLKPDETLTYDTSNKKKSSGYVLAKVPIPHSPPVKSSSLVVVGSNIYNIGCNIYNTGRSRSLYSNVSIFDCRSHTWREAPSLPVELFAVSAGVLDGKIYVTRSCKDDDSYNLKNTFEVFDTKTQVWDHVPSPYSETKHNSYSKSLCIDEKWYVVTKRKVVAYNPKKGKWDLVESEMCSYKSSYAYCEIENVLYSVEKTWRGTDFRWYDTELRQWRKVKGLVEQLPIILACVRLADYGGKMAVLWKENMTYGGSNKMLWCAVITLERRKNSEIWGKVEWFDHVLTVPITCVLEKVLVATV